MVSQPSPPPAPHTVPFRPQNVDQVPVHRHPTDKIRKYGSEEFCGLYNGDSTKVEYWLVNIQRVFDELTCSFEDSMKCSISLLKEDAYQWWITLTFVVSRDRVTWEFFRTEFRKENTSTSCIWKKKSVSSLI